MSDEESQEMEQMLEDNADALKKEGEASGEEASGEEAAGEEASSEEVSEEEVSEEEVSEEEVSGADGESGLAESDDEDSSQESEKDAGDENANIKLIMDLPLQVVVELGRTKMLINDLLQIGQGSVIELNKQVGEALDVLVNGKLVARGEVVVVKDKFGVRITEVLSTIERIKRLA
jgi:flagellar motor switch protein FliN/FliY